MSLTIVGSVTFAAALTPAVDKINATLDPRIKDAQVIAKTAEQMPKRSDGGPSFGFWKPKLRQIWLWDDLDEYPGPKTLWHEAMHVLDDDWFTRVQRQELLALMVPEPKSWYDQRINGRKSVYVALPSECFAVYASAALGGYEKPAYANLFLRRVPRGEWPLLAELALRDYGHAAPEPNPPDPEPTPPDPAGEEIRQLKQRLAAIEQLAKEKAEE